MWTWHVHLILAKAPSTYIWIKKDNSVTDILLHDISAFWSHDEYAVVVALLAVGSLLTSEGSGSFPSISNYYREHLFLPLEQMEKKKKRPEMSDLRCLSRTVDNQLFTAQSFYSIFGSVNVWGGLSVRRICTNYYIVVVVDDDRSSLQLSLSWLSSN